MKNGLTFVEPDMIQEACAMEGGPRRTAVISGVGGRSLSSCRLPPVSQRLDTEIITGPRNELHPGDELGKKAKPRNGSGWG